MESAGRLCRPFDDASRFSRLLIGFDIAMLMGGSRSEAKLLFRLEAGSGYLSDIRRLPRLTTLSSLYPIFL